MHASGYRGCLAMIVVFFRYAREHGPRDRRWGFDHALHVHPDDAFASAHLGCRNGKTESWIILDAEPGAQVHLGFREDVPRESWHWTYYPPGS